MVCSISKIVSLPNFKLSYNFGYIIGFGLLQKNSLSLQLFLVRRFEQSMYTTHFESQGTPSSSEV